MADRARDRFEIEQQVYRYGYAFDDGDVDGFASVFADDFVGEARMLGAAEPFSHNEGIEAARAFCEAGRNAQGLHHTTAIMFDELTATEARTRATVMATRQIDGVPTIATHGVYHDRWRRTDAGWKLAYRLYESHGYRMGPMAAAPVDAAAG